MSIEDRLGNKAEAWVAEEGDRLIGKIVGLSTLEGDYGPYPAVEIVDKEGKAWMWHAFDTVAKNELSRQSPAVGDDIGATFLGVKKTKPGSKYDSFKDWHVIVEKATGPVDVPDWSAIGDEAVSEGAEEFLAPTGTDDTF